MISKCKYYNDAQTSVNLMIDDFVPVAITFDQNINPSNDWGYLLDHPKSLYNYFDHILINKYPEIKGTFFIPLKQQHYLEKNKGYIIYKKEFDTEFQNFSERISNHFDFAFHGVKHNFWDEMDLNSKPKYEFQHLYLSDIPLLKNEIQNFEKKCNIKLTGGKFPGNRGNKYAYKIVEELGFKWWTSRKLFMENQLKNLTTQYFGENQNIINLQQTFHGNAFNFSFYNNPSLKNTARYFRTKYRMFKAERYLQFLFENKIPITIQEHFQNLTTSGRRQTVNVFDNIVSLDKIYGLLRGEDLWYCTSNELAHYIESYDKTELTNTGNGIYSISYKGNWNDMLLSFKCKCLKVRNIDSGKIHFGHYKNGFFIFNNLKEGKYELCP